MFVFPHNQAETGIFRHHGYEPGTKADVDSFIEHMPAVQLSERRPRPSWDAQYPTVDPVNL